MSQYINETTDYGLNADAIMGTIVYSVLGIAIMITTIVLVNALFKLDLHKELVKENNTAFGVLIGGLAIAIAIIIAGTITS